ncbi:homeobox protein siamois-like [Hyla sarda]|uniref:homeobox protein siamois-like n=1 Tax=Hyla sarda TaxID=327740 RepID=UPI0024C22E9F|nr:homeobox protein siamois-like [Hyla sarda]
MPFDSKNLKRTVMDTELDQVLCTVLSLEEDYPALSPPMRNQEHLCSPFYTVFDLGSNKEATEGLHHLDFLQQAACGLYSMVGLQKEPQIRPNMIHDAPISVTTSEELRENRQNKPLKRKYSSSDDDLDGCKKPRVEIYNHTTLASSARSRKKTIFSNEQTNFLQNQFESNPYPDFVHRCRISEITGIPEPRIQVWFQNRRARHPLRINRFLENKKLSSVSSTVNTPEDVYRLH